MDANHELALQGRDILLRALGADPPAPDDMIGAMAALPVPALAAATDAQAEARSIGLLRDRGESRYRSAAGRSGRGEPVARPRRPARCSCGSPPQRYLGPSDYEPLADWLATLGQVA